MQTSSIEGSSLPSTGWNGKEVGKVGETSGECDHYADSHAGQANKSEETKFKSGSSWTKKELHMLRVRFSRDMPEDGFYWDELFDTAGAIPANIQER